MRTYLLRRLFLLPITLFFILLVNFTIINLAPGDPVTVTEVSQGGEASRREGQEGFGSDMRYLQFREFYGLTLPVLFNWWPRISQERVEEKLDLLASKKYPDQTEIPFKTLQEMQMKFGDQAKYLLPKLFRVMNDPNESFRVRKKAMRYIIRGGTRQGAVGPNITNEERRRNRTISKENQFLRSQTPTRFDSKETVQEKMDRLNDWAETTALKQEFYPTTEEKWKIFFFETRFFRYFSRVLALDFGTLRNDSNKTVLSEVTKRFKYSLTLSITPMVLTVLFCIVLGFIMAINQNTWPDYSVNLTCLVLYAIPVFVVAPFLIEKVALHNTFPFTNTPIPISGFTSPESVYANLTTPQRLMDILRHIFLPVIAVMYGSFAAQSRLARTAVLEVMRQDYVRTARAKGLDPSTIRVKHVGRNAAITIVTSVASSLGIILGGSLIVETLFEINGFGKFFYDAVINRDYNVIMFSAIAGSFLTLVGYLAADISYTLLDPRVTLE